MAQQNTALAQVLNAMESGKDVSPKATQKAVIEANETIEKLEGKNEKLKEALMVTGLQVAHTAEIQGSTFLASTAEGYLGPERMKLAGVDLRAPTGIGLQVVGLYRAIKGKKGAGHFLSVGNGVTGSWVSSLGRAAGEALKEKREKNKAQTPAPADQAQAAPAAQPAPAQGQPNPNIQGAQRLEAQPRVSLLAEPAVQGPMREVYLTPAAGPRARQPAPARQQPQEQPRRQPQPGPQGPRRGGRFVRALASDDDAT